MPCRWPAYVQCCQYTGYQRSVSSCEHVASTCAQNSITHEFQFWFVGNVLTPEQEARLELVSMCAFAPDGCSSSFVACEGRQQCFLDRPCAAALLCHEQRINSTHGRRPYYPDTLAITDLILEDAKRALSKARIV